MSLYKVIINIMLLIYIQYAVHYILWLIYFYNWKSVPPKPLYLFHPIPSLPSLWQPPVCSLYLWVYFCSICSFICCFVYSTYKAKSYGTCLSLFDLFYLASKWIRVIANGKGFILHLCFKALCLLSYAGEPPAVTTIKIYNDNNISTPRVVHAANHESSPCLNRYRINSEREELTWARLVRDSHRQNGLHWI